MAHTGNPHPNISTTFIGRSRPDDDLWRHTPRSADPKKQPYKNSVAAIVETLELERLENYIFVTHLKVQGNLQLITTECIFLHEIAL